MEEMIPSQRNDSEQEESLCHPMSFVSLLYSYFHKWKAHRQFQLYRSPLHCCAVILSRQYLIRFVMLYFTRWAAAAHQRSLASSRRAAYRVASPEDCRSGWRATQGSFSAAGLPSLCSVAPSSSTATPFPTLIGVVRGDTPVRCALFSDNMRHPRTFQQEINSHALVEKKDEEVETTW